MAAAAFWLEEKQQGSRFGSQTREQSQSATAPGGAGFDSILNVQGLFTNFLQIFHVWIRWVASATVGNRTLLITFSDNLSSPLFVVETGVNIVASTTIDIMLGPGLPRGAGSLNVLYAPLPGRLVVPTSGKMNIKDSANIDGVGDTVRFNMMLQEFQFWTA